MRKRAWRAETLPPRAQGQVRGLNEGGQGEAFGAEEGLKGPEIGQMWGRQVDVGTQRKVGAPFGTCQVWGVQASVRQSFPM